MDIEKAIEYLTPIYNSASLEGYQAALGAVLNAARKQMEAEKWMSVKDAFPDCGGRFLVYEPGVGVYDAFFTPQNGRYFWFRDSLTPRNGITHWMPLPEPPVKEESQ